MRGDIDTAFMSSDDEEDISFKYTMVVGVDANEIAIFVLRN
jgi:hypothetical protein